jgi:site-specific DNA-methyltransferase (adenine-specific)
MNKKWDHDVPSVELWKEVLRVLKPGGHVLSFGGTRTYHRMVVNIEDAGFEIRDTINWLYGSGFPKSLNIGKQIDKIQGNEREIVGEIECGYQRKGRTDEEVWGKGLNKQDKLCNLTIGTSQYEGWGSGLKPACEMICMARKPISEKNIALNVLKWGTGGINIDKSRIPIDKNDKNQRPNGSVNMVNYDKKGIFGAGGRNDEINGNTLNMAQGRFPSNVILSDDEEVLELFPNTKNGGKKNAIRWNKGSNGIDRGEMVWGYKAPETIQIYGGDSGSASRFFYVAKASPSERNLGLEGFEKKQIRTTYDKSVRDKQGDDSGYARTNFHPTVKPIKLMQYLVRLVTPQNGTCLDMFMGSGTTGIACVKEGFNFVGMELNEEYFKIAEARINYFMNKK